MIRFEIETVTTFELDEAFVWPDGEENPTAAGVRYQIEECELFGAMFGIVDANDFPRLRTELRSIAAVEVDVPNPAYAGDDVLFGDPPSRTIVDRVDL